MVSGFLTSPWDHSRILSGEAIEIRIALKASGSFGFSNRLYRSRKRITSSGELLVLDQLDVEAQSHQFLHEHVEALRQTRLERVLALHDGLVHAGAAADVVRLDGEELLEGEGGAVGLHRPHLHLAEALAAELRLAAQRLL